LVQIKHTTDELQAALRPIASLISKSEKAHRKLTPGTWQHTMLRDNLKALQVASALMNKKMDAADRFTRDNLLEALQALASMISKTEKTQAKFSPGTSQHTLQRNRLKALRIAGALMQSAVGSRPNRPALRRRAAQQSRLGTRAPVAVRHR
jgi:hypothetical protein